MQLPKWLLPCADLAVVLLLSCRPAALLGQNSHPKAKDLPTRITIGTHVLRRDVQRFGINLGGENFYDSGQILRNLVARNPGFQGQTWQSILRCTTFTRTACTAARMAWPASFLANGTFEVATGPAAGTRGTIRTSNGDGNAGAYTVQFASALAATPANGDYLIVRSRQPGDPTAGWWTSFECGATATAELHDLPPHSPGRQVLRIDAARPCQRAALNSYFDSTPGHAFVHLNGAYTLRFQAKALTTKLHPPGPLLPRVRPCLSEQRCPPSTRLAHLHPSLQRNRKADRKGEHRWPLVHRRLCVPATRRHLSHR